MGGAVSRSGYSDDYDGDGAPPEFWEAAVKRAVTGKRGQAFMREMLSALDAMPVKALEKSVLVKGTACCAMGAVAIARKLDTSGVDAECTREVGNLLGIARSLAGEIAFHNDDDFGHLALSNETPEQRWVRMRAWVAEQIEVRPEELLPLEPTP